jgi:4-amino-4-deoxy-L-arabinose transferase-like glycosyltransferase
MAEAAEFERAPGSPGKVLLAVFLGALALRWAYAAVMYLTMGDAGLMGPDSVAYYENGQIFAERVAAGSISGWRWLGLDPLMFPLFNSLVAASVALFGRYGALAYVCCQGLIDAGTCLAIAGIARTIDHRLAVPAALAAAVNPTQIVVSGQIYPDTGFVLFIALALWAAIRWLRAPSWHTALLVGGGFGAASMFRILVTAFMPALLAYLLVVSVIRNGLRVRMICQAGAAGAVFAVCIGTVSVRNKTQYDSWALTPQAGIHLALWVVQAQDGSAWVVGHDEMERRTRARFGPKAENPFEDSRFYAEIAYEQLRTFGVAAFAKAWAYGAVINLGSPAIILSPPIMQLPRTGFYDTPGASMPEKMRNFLLHSENALYGWVLLIGTLGVAVVRLVQLAGLVGILRRAQDFAPLLLLAGWCLYILLINGPVAQPKHRLPLEPVLCVLSGAGLLAIGSLRRRQGITAPPPTVSSRSA